MRTETWVIPFILVLMAVAIIGETIDMGEWYQTNKPDNTLSDDILWGMWAITHSLFFFAFLASYSRKKTVLIDFVVNLIGQVLWVVLFFHSHQTTISFVISIALLLHTFFLMMTLKSISSKSHNLLIPYIMWLSVIVLLNWHFVYAI